MVRSSYSVWQPHSTVKAARKVPRKEKKTRINIQNGKSYVSNTDYDALSDMTRTVWHSNFENASTYKTMYFCTEG